MRFTFVPYLLLLGFTFCSSIESTGQELLPDNPKNYIATKFLSLSSQNDLYHPTLKSDKYYTNGLQITYGTPGLDNKVNRFSLLGMKDAYNDFALSLNQDIYTPENQNTPEIDSSDRPYAGLLYISSQRYSSSPKKGDRLTSSLYIGVIGPASMARELQTLVHRISPGSDEPQGWDNQIGNGLMLDYQVEYEKLLPLYTSYFEPVAGAVGHIGTIYNFATLSLGFKLGWFNSSFLHAGGKNNNRYARDQVMHVGYTRNGKEKQRMMQYNRLFQCYLFFRANATYMVYDGTLQGSLLAFESSPYVFTADRLKHNYSRLNYGICVSYRNLAFSYEAITHRDVIKDAGAAGWGQLKLIITL